MATDNPLSSEPCWFSRDRRQGDKALEIRMHITTGIAGGVGPTGSVRAMVRKILIPRSRYAAGWHTAGMLFRLFVLAAAIVFFVLSSGEGEWLKAGLLSAGILLAGSLLMHLAYRLAGVKPSVSALTSHPGVRSLREKGYQTGFHPVISSTPFGWIWLFIRRFLI